MASWQQAGMLAIGLALVSICCTVPTWAKIKGDPLHCRYDVPQGGSYLYKWGVTAGCKPTPTAQGLSDPTLSAMQRFTATDIGEWNSLTSGDRGKCSSYPAAPHCQSCSMALPRFAQSGVVPLTVGDGWWLHPEPGATCGMCFKISVSRGRMSDQCSAAKGAGDWTKYFSYPECPPNGGGRYQPAAPPAAWPWNGHVLTDSSSGLPYVIGVNMGWSGKALEDYQYGVSYGMQPQASQARPQQQPYAVRPQQAARALSVHATNVARVQQLSGKEVRYVLYGDSITELGVGLRFGVNRYPARANNIFHRYFGQNSLPLAIASDATFNLLWRLQNGELGDMKPKVAVILIGSNDIAYSDFAKQRADPTWASKMAAAVRESVHYILTKSPSTKVLLQAVLPRASSNKRMWPDPRIFPLWKEYNGLLQGLAQADARRVGYVDCGWAVVADDGKKLPPKLLVDKVHPSEAAYHRMYPCVVAAAERLMAGRSIAPLSIQPTPCPIQGNKMEFAFIASSPQFKLQIAGQRIPISGVQIQWKGEKKWFNMIRAGNRNDDGFGDGDGHWQLPSALKRSRKTAVSLRLYCSDGSAALLQTGLVPDNMACELQDPNCKRVVGSVQC